MPDTSKQIGQVWTTLSAAEKEVGNHSFISSFLPVNSIGLSGKGHSRQTEIHQ